MDLEDGFTAFFVRKGNGEDTVETTWTEKGWIENVVSVGGSHNEDAGVVFETVHLDKELVEGLLTFIVASA